jgi:hypothetical protein
MKRRNLILLYSCILGNLLVSCTEIYDAEVESGENIIFIEGGITNGTGTCTIKLQYAQAYGSADNPVTISGARVELYEDGKFALQFIETGSGVYQTGENTPERKPGRNYKLVITAPDGNIYESEPQLMPALPDRLEAVYGIDEIIKLKYYNVYGEFIVKEQEIVQLYADIPVGNQNTYSRFECRSILEYLTDIIVNPNSSEAHNVPLYLWESFNSEDLNVLEISNSLSSIKKFPVAQLINDKENFANLKYNHSGSVQRVYDSVPTGTVEDTVYSDTGFVIVDSIVYGVPVDLHENTYYTGWILYITQYSISKAAYLYWTDIKKLEESNGELFDPINTQLRGNMLCVTDPDKIMIGLFEVASTTITPAFINFEPTEGNYLSRTLEETENISSSGWNDTIPPFFWVHKIIP